MPAYRVLGRKAEAGRSDAGSSDEGPLVGRDQELAALGVALDKARQGFGTVVCLIGDAGLGKTRLVRELQRSVPREGGESWFETGSRSYEATRPYALFARLIRRLARAGPNDPAEALRQKIAALFDGLAPEQRSQCQRVVESVLGLPDVSGEPPLEGETFKRLFLTANRILLKRLSASSGGSAPRQPAVVVCDDLHWTDTASVDLLCQLLAVTDEEPLLVVCSFRPDRQAPCWRLKVVADAEYAHRYTEIMLRPLSELEGAALLQAVLRGAEVPSVTRERILAKSSGVPFFIEEVVRGLIDRGLIERLNGGLRWAAATTVDEVDVPDSLQSLLVARIDRLEEASRSTLQLAAVAGPAFFHRVLARVIGGDTAGLDRQLATLVRVAMIRETSREPELQYTFSNLLTHEAAYNTILLRHRREFHRRVGEALEVLFPARRDELAPVLAHHFSEARDDARALQYHTLAGDAAYRLSAYVEAIAHYSAAVARAERVRTGTPELSRLYTLRGRALEFSARYEEALVSYTEMSAVAEQRSDPALRLGALVARGTVHSTRTPLYDPARAETLAAEGLALAGELGDRTAAARINWNLMLLMLVRAGAGDLNRALDFGEASVAIARELDLREQMALALNDLVMIYNTLGHPERAREAAEESRQLFRELGNLPMLADSYGQASFRLMRSGDFDGTLAAAAECRQISESIGNLWNLASSSVASGWAHMERGEVGRAMEGWDTATRSSGIERLPFLHGFLLVSLAVGYETLGATVRAMDLCRRVIAGPGTVLPDVEQWARAILTGLHLSRNDIGEARAEIARVRTDMNREGLMALVTVPLAFSAHGELALATADFQHALSLMNDLEELTGSLHCEACLPQTLYLKGRALRGLGRQDEAREALEHARAVARATGERRYAWRILASLAEIEGERADASRAQTLLRQAHDIIDHIARHAGRPDLRETFLDSPAARAVLARSG